MISDNTKPTPLHGIQEAMGSIPSSSTNGKYKGFGSKWAFSVANFGASAASLELHSGIGSLVRFGRIFVNRTQVATNVSRFRDGFAVLPCIINALQELRHFCRMSEVPVVWQALFGREIMFPGLRG